MEREGLSYQVAARQLYHTEAAKLEGGAVAMQALNDILGRLNGET